MVSAGFPAARLLELPYVASPVTYGYTYMTTSLAAIRAQAGLDALFRGFADPTRLRILNVLAAGEMCVCDLVALLRLPQPTVSRHLAYLRRVGLVAARREPRYAYYRLTPPRDAVHANLIGCVRDCFGGVAPLGSERRAAQRQVRRRKNQPCE